MNMGITLKVKKSAESLLKELNDFHGETVRQMVIEYLRSEKNDIDDTAFHSWAESKGIQPDVAESAVYNVMREFLSTWKEGEYDVEELKRGIEVEKEHTANPLLAEKIARDHLEEDATYYTKLDQMEL